MLHTAGSKLCLQVIPVHLIVALSKIACKNARSLLQVSTLDVVLSRACLGRSRMAFHSCLDHNSGL